MHLDDDKGRFSFGKIWESFLRTVDTERIEHAQSWFVELTAMKDLSGKSFFDIGSGSGLSSLIARRLGASVHSIDYDLHSVACTTELRRRHFPDDPKWSIEQGSVLDVSCLEKLGTFDIVYSWGVLHHTGAMWLGLENCIAPVKPNGKLYIAIYNDQGIKSHIWWMVKWTYSRLPKPINTIYAYGLGLFVNGLNILKYSLRGKPMLAIEPLLSYQAKRGMSWSHDLLDWIGGFPFEFASNELMIAYMSRRGFDVVANRPASSLGCHEWVFHHRAD